MLPRLLRVWLTGIAGCLVLSLTHAESPPGVEWSPQLQAIQDAGSLADADLRQAALKAALRKGLLESEPEAADLVFDYLTQNKRWLDLQPFEDIIMEYSKIDHLHRGGRLLDFAELLRAPKAERVRVYSAAIVEGSTTLERGDRIIRQVAMGLAADDGLDELKPLIEVYYPEESPDARRQNPLPELLIRLELGAGAVDREDAGRLASERLAAMKDGEFRDRMNTDEAFRKVVDQVASYVCAVDPFARRRNPGCASVKEIVRRQVQLEEQALQANRAATATSTSPPQPDQEPGETWLVRMRRSSAREPCARRPD